jgi:hypothetical protein
MQRNRFIEECVGAFDSLQELGAGSHRRQHAPKYTCTFPSTY